jgi:hypothetical protein
MRKSSRPLHTPPLVRILSSTHTHSRIKFVLPEIIFDPSLILSPHVFLLGLIFADGAFAAPNLRSASQLSGLDIRPGRQQLELLFKPSMLDVPIFRKSVKTGYGYKISPREPLTYPTLLSLMRVIGLILGLLQPTRPYCLRYNAANEFNQSGEYHVLLHLRL